MTIFAPCARGFRGTLNRLLALSLSLSSQQIFTETKASSWIEIDYTTLQRGTNARESWRLNALTSYVYEIEQHCYCSIPDRARVYVEQGKVAWVENLDNGRLINTPEILTKFKTIPQLFVQIDLIMANKPDAVSLEHDRYLGFPAVFRADPQFIVADDEIDYRIHWLKLLPHD